MNKHFSKEDIQMPTDISKKKKKTNCSTSLIIREIANQIANQREWAKKEDMQFRGKKV